MTKVCMHIQGTGLGLFKDQRAHTIATAATLGVKWQEYAVCMTVQGRQY